MSSLSGKDAIRAHWMALVDATIAPNERCRAHILFLPGLGAPEVPLYRGLGFGNARLRGVEREAAVARKIRRAERDLNLYRGTMADFAAENAKTPEPIRFQAMHLDYSGGLATIAEDTVTLLPFLETARGAAMGFTTIGARDRATISLASFYLSLLREAIGIVAFQRAADVLIGTCRNASIGRSDAECARHVARELMFLAILGAAMGSAENDAQWNAAFTRSAESFERSMRESPVESFRHTSIPTFEVPDIGRQFRRVCVSSSPDAVYRFAYFSHDAKLRMRAWHLRFSRHTPLTLSVVIAQLIERFLRSPLHNFDVVGNRVSGHCRLCD